LQTSTIGATPDSVRLNLKPEIREFGDIDKTIGPEREIIVLVFPAPNNLIVFSIGIVTILAHVHVPAGTLTVSPEIAELIAD
jgi:propanediol utilization protein